MQYGFGYWIREKSVGSWKSVIQMDNQYIVLNDKDEEKTLKLYQNLQLKIKNRESH